VAPPPHTLEAWLRLHPLPPQLEGKRLDYLWHFDLPAPTEVVWSIVSDTSRMNRALKRAEMKFEEKDGLRHGTARLGPRLHRWVEVPWSWVAGQWLANMRLYQQGYMTAQFAVQRVEPLGDDLTRLYTYFGFTPRGWLGARMIQLGFPSLERDYARVLPAMVAEATRRALPEGLVQPPPPLAPDAAARLAAIGEQLRGQGLDARVVGALLDWVRTGDDLDVMRIQVRERARAWDADEDAVLSVFLHATRAGLLQLSWDVVCPHCRGAVEEHARAMEIPRDGACEVCAIDFATDDVVEITFHVHPSIRTVERRAFCSAEPARKGHIRVQQVLAAGERREITPALGAGRWRMRVGGTRHYGYLDAGAGGRGELEWRASDPPREVVAAPAPALRLINDTAAPATFVVEATQWSDAALRPGRLLSFQEFRDLFSEEYLGADVQLSVGEQTILFTDMVGSTAMYAVRGDPAAFVEVKRHFDELFAIIRTHRGAVVKTIGDAAMGAFNDPLDAVRAARAIHAAFPPGRADLPARLRISLNTGPCIAVRLNANIDYFGGTVNVAAKLQSLAEAWQITMAEATWSAPGVADWVAGQGGAVEPVTYTSKALREPVAARRWTVHVR
jgi:class 3 adenylate cyclase